MSFLNRWIGWVKDPPPDYAFEISPAGIAWAGPPAARGAGWRLGFRPLEPGILSVSPLRDNVLRPDSLTAAVQALAPPNGHRRRRRAALVLPDYCGRVAVLDFDAFPSEPAEQAALVRFRIKKSVPFDIDSAAVSFQHQGRSGNGRKQEVLVAVVALEIVARYEAPFRAAGFLPGFVTTSALASLPLLASGRSGPSEVILATRLCGRTLTVSVIEGGRLKLVRCVELAEVSPAEILAVILPTLAFVEDELHARPRQLLLCGFDPNEERLRIAWEAEVGLPAEPWRSRFGTPGPNDAGLLGYLESIGR